MLKFDFKTYNNKYINESDVNSYKDSLEKIKKELFNGNLTKWMSTSTYIDKETIEDIKITSKRIQENSDVLVVIGIGGSYMGAKAVISALAPKYKKNDTEVLFFGYDLNPNSYIELFEYLDDKDFSINVISKSGNTLEPNLAFDAIYEYAKKKYNDNELKERIIITTDKEKGKLRELVNDKGYKSFIVPDTVGGRFSVLTPVGMLPISVAGYDIEMLLDGANNAINNYIDDALNYSVIRDIMQNKGKEIESYIIYDEKMIYFLEWLKQLFAESLGKDGKGIYPVYNYNSRDLHSLGQFHQDGKDIIFETAIGVENDNDFIVDGNNLKDVNNIVLKSVCIAHNNGHTPSSVITIDRVNEYSLGELIQFFYFSVISGGLLSNVNPFDQPGVEEYKRVIKENL